MNKIKENVLVEERDGTYNEYQLEYNSYTTDELMYNIRSVFE